MKLFLLLIFPEIEQEILNESCRWDRWTAQFVEFYRAVGLASPVALAVLRSIAVLLKWDTSQTEAGHATIRRVSCILGCQTHAEAFVHASAEHLLRQARSLRRQLETNVLNSFSVAPSDSPSAKQDPAQADSAPPKNGGAGVGIGVHLLL